MLKRTKKICNIGHTFYNNSDYPTCPVCEKLKDPASSFLGFLSNPARNALIHYHIDTIEKLATFTEKEVLNIHGIGKASIPLLKEALKKQGLTFKIK